MPENMIGAFLPTTQVYDPSTILKLDANSEEFKLFLVYLYQQNNNIASMVNLKATGYYPLVEFVSGKLWYPNPTQNSSSNQTPTYRQGYVKVTRCGQLANTGTTVTAHNIDLTGAVFRPIHIYGVARDLTAGTYIPIPFASPTLANNIEITVDNTNINITTGSNRTNFTECDIVIEYIKN